MAGDDAVARVGRAGIDAEGDHGTGILRAGPDAFPGAPRPDSAPATVDGMAALRLSVLDQSPIAEGSTGAQALRNTLDLARLADELGYHRYWVAEHHGGAAARRAEPRGPDRPDRGGDPAASAWAAAA